MHRKTAKEILADSFWELAEKKAVDKITVREIAENCGYSPATFYRQFKDKYDLIAWEYTRGVAYIMDKIGTDGYTWKQTLLEGTRAFQTQKDYLANLFLHTGGQDAFILYMTQINYTALRGQICRVMYPAVPDQKTDMYIRLYCLGTVSLTCEWILGKHAASPEELADIFMHSLPAPLHPYLLENEKDVLE